MQNNHSDLNIAGQIMLNIVCSYSLVSLILFFPAGGDSITQVAR